MGTAVAAHTPLRNRRPKKQPRNNGAVLRLGPSLFVRPRQKVRVPLDLKRGQKRVHVRAIIDRAYIPATPVNRISDIGRQAPEKSLAIVVHKKLTFSVSIIGR